jgi:hypothetical protein
MNDIEKQLRAEFDCFGEPPARIAVRILGVRAAVTAWSPASAPDGAPSVLVDDAGERWTAPPRPAIRRRPRWQVAVNAALIVLVLAGAVIGIGLHGTATAPPAHPTVVAAGSAIPVTQAASTTPSTEIVAPDALTAKITKALQDLQITTLARVEVGPAGSYQHALTVTPVVGADRDLAQFDTSLVAAAVLGADHSIDQILWVPFPGNAAEPLDGAGVDGNPPPAPKPATIVEGADTVAQHHSAGTVKLDRITLRGSAPTVLVQAHVAQAPTGDGVDITAITDLMTTSLPTGASWLVEITDPTGTVVATTTMTPIGGFATAVAPPPTTSTATTAPAPTTTGPGLTAPLSTPRPPAATEALRLVVAGAASLTVRRLTGTRLAITRPVAHQPTTST